jgi:Xaa-Pro aminopeptidase
MVCDRRHVHYFTGFWCSSQYAPLALVGHKGPTVLVVPFPWEHELAADETVVYPSNHIGTLVDDHPAAAAGAIQDRLRSLKRIGCDGLARPWLVPSAEVVDIHDVILTLRRRKDADEVELLRQAIEATEAAYRYAFGALKAGVTEVDLFAGMQAAAAAHAGEVIGEFGNDFQIGATGSAPRRRPAQNGEMAVFDLSVGVRGYRSDMCRSFVVGGRPSDQQLDAHRRIMQALAHVERTVRPGTRCKQLYEEVLALLNGYKGWSFPHHLGHGIGLSGHEAPRLNPHWDDTFEVGDVFTAEPGLYGPNLNAGERIEQIYHLSSTGLETLTTFPTALA